MAQVMQSSLLTLAVLEHVSVHQPVRVAEVAEALGSPRAPCSVHWSRSGKQAGSGPTARSGPDGCSHLGCSRCRAAPPTSTACTTRRIPSSTRSGASHASRGSLRSATAPTGSSSTSWRDCARSRSASRSAGASRCTPVRRARRSWRSCRRPRSTSCSATELRAFTDRTITSPVVLREELERIRAVGHAYSECEVSAGIHSLAAPVFDRSGAVIASLSLTIPESRLDGHTPELAARLVGAAASITSQLRPRHAVGTPAR